MVSESIIEKLNSNPIKERIIKLFQEEGKSYSEIFHEIEKEFSIGLFQKTGKKFWCRDCGEYHEETKFITGLFEVFLNMFGYSDGFEYRKNYKIYRTIAREKFGFTKRLKEEVIELFNFKCALCEENKFLHVHHIDGDFKNNEKTNLISLCKEHHKFAQSNRCLICGKSLVKISKGLIIDGKDISELKYIHSYTCIKHHPLSLRVYDKGKLKFIALNIIVDDKLNQRDSEIQKKIEEEIHKNM